MQCLMRMSFYVEPATDIGHIWSLVSSDFNLQHAILINGSGFAWLVAQRVPETEGLISSHDVTLSVPERLPDRRAQETDHTHKHPATSSEKALTDVVCRLCIRINKLSSQKGLRK
jgi:hypothetical protein